jgi:hypothetical protein
MLTYAGACSGKSAKRIKNKAHINKEQSASELKLLLQERMLTYADVCV